MKPWLSALLILLGSTPAFANGAMASFPAGGVEFKDSADISIAREDLRLGPGEVRVQYRFVSTAAEPQTVTIGFPLPRVPSSPDTPDSVGAVEGSGGDMRNYLGFGVSVDERPLIPILHEFAWLGEKDVTATILAAGLPLISDYETWQVQSAKLSLEEATALVAAGLVYGKPGGYLDPLWDYQAIYEWSQEFTPGETEVDIRYKPLMGWPGDFGSTYEVGEHADSACVDDALRAEIAAREADGHYYQVAQLDYITQTAKHWHGPIGEFNLSIDASQPENWAASDSGVLFASCPVAPTQLGEHEWGFTAKDYVPNRDVRVFFYFFD
jgi:hypothetical protein